MKISFSKYQGTGNDFVLLDNREGIYSDLLTEQIRHLCDRRFGIGADGLMMLNNKDGYDFEMKYFNSDGREGSMCGNGGRCIVKFASDICIEAEEYNFLAVDGDHKARISNNGDVQLQMQDVNSYEHRNGEFVINTGSPHYVKIVNNLFDMDVVERGREIRYNKEFSNDGINVNFVEAEIGNDHISVRTYERGVEDETYSCGTGVTAAALVNFHNQNGFNAVYVATKGGNLTVEFDRTGEDQFRNIWLCGPAQKVFDGSLELPE